MRCKRTVPPSGLKEVSIAQPQVAPLTHCLHCEMSHLQISQKMNNSCSEFETNKFKECAHTMWPKINDKEIWRNLEKNECNVPPHLFPISSRYFYLSMLHMVIIWILTELYCYSYYLKQFHSFAQQQNLWLLEHYSFSAHKSWNINQPMCVALTQNG